MHIQNNSTKQYAVAGLSKMNILKFLSKSYLMRLILILIAASGLAACGGGGGADTVSLPNTGTVTASNYNGPPPSTDDVQLFKLNVWDNLVDQNRCGACHGTSGQSPNFVRGDNINLAYTEANKIVNLAEPSESRMVTKVAGGHNCWLPSDQGCADTITQYIVRWAGDSVGSVKGIELTEPTSLSDPDDYLSLDTSPSNYQALYDLFTDPARGNCVRCHSRAASELSQSPYFAETSLGASNLEESYKAAFSKIDPNDTVLGPDDEPQSRFYIRLAKESHNCWTDCQTDADTILALIQAMSTTTSELDPDAIASKLSPTLPNGSPANTGGRYESNIIAKWEFKTGEGTVAYDTSGLEPAINLNLLGDVEWVGGWGIRLAGGKAQGSTSSSTKLFDLIKSSGEYSIETWVAPANVTQEGPAVIIDYGGSDTRRNFTLGQTMYNYDFLQRSSTTDLNGEPALSTPDGEEILQATQQHVVATFSPSAGRQLFVNGKLIEEPDSVSPGNLNDWDDTYAFVLGSEPSGNDAFEGTIRMVAIHNRALTEEQIKNNYDVGVGQKFYLMFSVSHLLENMPKSYIVFEVSQFDSYSYLFNAPFFISLDPDAVPDHIPLGGIRLGLNGQELEVGQAFTNLSVNELDAAYYTSEAGQQLSDVGTIIPLDGGPEVDQFFLIFESIGDHTDGAVSEPGDPVDHLVIQPSSDQPRIAVRNFDEIVASMAKLTGVNASDVPYEDIELSLPSSEDPLSFVPSNNVAITQLAIEYCNTLITDAGYTTRRNSLFDSSLFSSGADFSGADKTDLLTDLYEAFIGNGLDTQPASSDFDDEVSLLIDELATDMCGGANCNASETQKVVTGACASVLASSTMLLQ
ncbi:LamG domain-containing protein [Hahella ganghwensis]|uniref:LamG domain-containing protein n=1 Tax=Hahella ganghwensis TaxID=286420 RepID=UPI000382CA63|nr:LamG domain-containing protein [Hahella ganghwensis]